MRKGWLPKSLTRRVRRQTFCTAFAGVAGITPDGGRLQFGTVAGIKSESRPGIKRPADSYSAALTMDVGSLQPSRGALEAACRWLRATAMFRPKIWRRVRARERARMVGRLTKI